MAVDDMENMILSNQIIARCNLKNQIIFYKEYNDLSEEGLKINDIYICEIKNIKTSSFTKNGKVDLVIEFDIIIVYECHDNNGYKRYRLLSENIKKNIDIDFTLYKPSVSLNEADNLKCENMIRNIRYLTDIDLSGKKAVITVYCDILSFFYKESLIKLSNSSISVKEGETIMDEQKNLNKVLNSSDQESLDLYIENINNLLKKASEVNLINKELEAKIASKDKKIAYLEYKNNELNKENTRLAKDLEEKEKEIYALKSNLEKAQKKIALLQNTNQALNKEIEAFEKENIELKNYKNEEEEKKKKQLNYRIKAAINNIKLFT